MFQDNSSFAHDARWVLLAVCLAALALPLSFTGGALATHIIGLEFSASPAQLNWITNSFMLTFGSLMLPCGVLADVYGRKRLFISGVVLFALASLMLNFSHGIGFFNLMRALQGVGAAAALSGGSAALAQEFSGHAQTWAFGMIGTTFGIGLAAGPVISGVLIAHFGWRSIFLLGVVIDCFALILALKKMRETRILAFIRFDWPGALAFVIAIASLTLALNTGPVYGWQSVVVISLFLLSLGAFISFGWLEKHTSYPLLDLSLFKYGRFLGVQILPLSTCYCWVVLLVLLPLRFVGIEGYSEVQTGIIMLALSGPVLFIPSLAAFLAKYIRANILAGGGLILAATGIYWLIHIPSDSPVTYLIAPLVLIGFGAGFPWGLMDGLSVTVVPRDKAGMASGIFNTTKVACEGITLAIVNALLATFILNTLRQSAHSENQIADAARLLATGNLNSAGHVLNIATSTSLRQVYNDGFDTLLYVLTIMTLLAAACVFVLLSQKQKPLD
ncbi:MFS transporter [Kosakonia sp. MUSA4]|uniref:MFS transporter n=1 Tax=Kosakonia sp. MUSA4 TaxID=2067958 RepID=UPI001597EFE4|nr:MFS transporter [Kosakonia sp. MUSA4]QJT82284.1 MFS transporter [Kosakonia sp. MUSA4]